MIKSLLVGFSLLFVMCSTVKEENEFVDKNKVTIKFSGTHTGNRIVDVEEIEINGKKYILAIGCETVAICPSKNE